MAIASVAFVSCKKNEDASSKINSENPTTQSEVAPENQPNTVAQKVKLNKLLLLQVKTELQLQISIKKNTILVLLKKVQKTKLSLL